MTGNIRTACPVCHATGELLEVETGLWRVCHYCEGNCHFTETPQPHGVPQPDVRDMDTDVPEMGANVPKVST